MLFRSFSVEEEISVFSQGSLEKQPEPIEEYVYIYLIMRERERERQRQRQRGREGIDSHDFGV